MSPFIYKLKNLRVSVGNFLSANAAELRLYYSAFVHEAVSLFIRSAGPSVSASVSPATSNRKAYDDQPTLYIRRTDSEPTVSASVAIVTPDVSQEATVAPATEFGLQWPVAGAVADDGGSETDETSAATNATANDMTLIPAVPAVDDAYYIGHGGQFDRIWLNIGQSGNGNWVVTEEYWNGASWAAFTVTYDSISSFIGGSGMVQVTFTLPGDWALQTIQSKNLYWMRFRVTSYTSITTQPKGTQAWVEVLP